MAFGLVGLGVQGILGVPLGGLSYLSECDTIYADVYTTPWPDGLMAELEARVGKPIIRASRVMVEDGRAILTEAKAKRIALVTVGDPLLATTHITLKERAKECGIETRVFYSSSILNVLFGETGLHIYKLGKVITAVRGRNGLSDSVYSEVKENLFTKRHTLILLEYDPGATDNLTPEGVLQEFVRLESNFRLGVFSDDRLMVVASRVGWPTQSIQVGTMKEMLGRSYGTPPYSMIVPTEFHYTELDALSSLPGADKRTLESASTAIQPPTTILVNKTVRKTLVALQKGRELAKENGIKKLDSLFENVECYLSDAQRFLLDGKPELALIEAGYAEGLLDSLRFQGILKLDW